MSLRRCPMFALATLVVSVLAASPLSAQTIVDARRIEFTPSPDHNTVDPSGVAVVQWYAIDVFVAGGISAVASADLGKPVPGSDGMIRLDFVALLSSPLATGVTYEAAVRAIGPGGTSAAERSNPFAFSGPCTVSMSPTSASFAAAGGTGSSVVTAGSGCAWTAASHASWITVTSGAAGAGGGSVGFSVAANTSTTNRTGTLTIAGATFTVTQGAAAPTGCDSSISPTSRSFTVSGGTGSSFVTAASSCAWDAVSNAAWIAVFMGARGTGNGSVTFVVATNSTGTSRTGTLTIAGKTFTVTQSGPCSYSVAPTTLNVSAPAVTGAFTVTAQPGCPWSPSVPPSWITLSGAGSGSGALKYTIALNMGKTARTGTFTVAGQTVTVTQAGRLGPPANVRVLR